jgi:hypothetical protein
MTTQPSGTTNGDDFLFKPMMNLWFEGVRQAANQTQAVLDGANESLDLKALRQRWLEALTEGLDTFMRSPVFLEGMKRHFEMMSQLKSTQEHVAGDVSRSTGIPRISDISGLFERLQIAQETVLDRLQAIEYRLQRLENKGGGEPGQ